MGFSKSWIAAVFMFAFFSCTSKVTQTPKTEQPVAEATPAVQQVAVAKTLPSFTVLDATGNKLDIQQYKGKKVFVNLWATWCPPCRAELPSIEKLYKSVDTTKVQFVMLSLDNDFETAKQFVQKKGVSLPIFYPAGDVPQLFTVDGIPSTFIFDEAGNLVTQREGSEDYNTAAFRKLFGVIK